MGQVTSIQWTDATWNPIRGCSRVSEGCRNCYAESTAGRFSGPGQPYEGLVRRRNGKAMWTGEVRVIDAHMLDPMRWQKPRRIFVNSMSDLFHEQVSDATLDRIFAVMALAPQHTFQILTKRPGRMVDYLAGADDGRREAAVSDAVLHEFTASAPRRQKALLPLMDQWEWPLRNVWLGVSAENQDTADERIPLLLQTPAAVRWISAEPLLGPIDFEACGSYGAAVGDPFGFSVLHGADGVDPPIPGLDWVVTGGESGDGARPCQASWLRDIVRDCELAKVPVFVKQLGAHFHDEVGGRPRCRAAVPRGDGDWSSAGAIRDSHGGNMAEWPDDLCVRQLPPCGVPV